MKTDWPAFSFAFPTSAFQAVTPDDEQGGRLLEREGGWLEGGILIVGDERFSEGARLLHGRHAENFITDLEPFHTRPQSFDHAGEIMAQAAWKTGADEDLQLSPAKFPVHGVCRGSPDLDADLTAPGL
jgi:hypothetical protein